ncbi:hypothetical protein [Arthrobacter glacialis]|uniref:Uncharacterized protein n=1 Tax=Arthrobacter glacialis TaxID=1664 RepID=A0A2S3ZVN4_ARTGL|nr:hypothetical protein [Arthrobacter glacialis]POH73144.1 hypothetical protein CVS27_11460 [Arthrobacter glacialis]
MNSFLNQPDRARFLNDDEAGGQGSPAAHQQALGGSYVTTDSPRTGLPEGYVTTAAPRMSPPGGYVTTSAPRTGHPGSYVTSIRRTQLGC